MLQIVVSTVVSGIHFARFPVEMESSLSVGWAITFFALFLQSYIHWRQHTMGRSCDPYGQFINFHRTLDVTQM